MSLGFLDYLADRIEGRERSRAFELGSKDMLRVFSDVVGVRLPQEYFRGPIGELDIDALPQRFVLKPTFASSSIGIYLLERLDGSYVDARNGSEIDLERMWDHLRDVAVRFLGDDSSDAVFVAEEIMVDSRGVVPARDYRFYSFQGEIGLIHRDDHMNGERSIASYYDGSFHPIRDVLDKYSYADSVKHLEAIDPSPDVPDNWRALLETARRISCAVPSPFVRVDLYDTPRGAILGEMTFFSGTFHYRNRKLMSDSESQRLGRLWERAARRLEDSNALPPCGR